MTRSRSRTTSLAVTVLSAVVVAATACTAGNSTSSSPPPSINPSASHAPVTLTFWTEWSDPSEFATFNSVVAGFHQKYPWITVNTKKGLTDDKILAAISAGNPPDAVLSFGLDNVAKFCSSGAWQNLTPFIQQSKLDLKVFPPAVFKYTSYNGSQCAFPFLTDAYGLYYNKDMLAAKGITEPPKTWSELTDMAKKLTVFNPDGSIKVAGFVPWFGWYETNSVTFGVPADAQYYNQDLTASALATDPNWAKLLQWQKQLVDFYGADNLAKFVAGSGEEFSSNQDFETGRIAMNMDGEWRTAFIGREAPKLNYGTAPFPVPDDEADRYGVGQIGGTIIGIPKGAAHPAEAWLLVSYLATTTDALVQMANKVGNVPTTYDALASPDLQLPPQFQTFLDIFKNPGSYYKGNTPIGAADQNTFALFLEKWQNDKVSDLQAGLEDTAKQIDDLLAQAGVG
jgi:multiple sugar transport system substrate-binding protein